MRSGSALTNSDLPIQPVPRALILNGNERPIGTTFESNAHTSAFFGDGLDVRETDIPLRLELLGAHEHDTCVRQ